MKITDKDVRKHMLENPEVDYHTAMVEIEAKSKKTIKKEVKKVVKD